MKFGRSYPYRRLTDLDGSVERPASLGNLRRAVTVALVIGAVGLVVLLGLFAFLLALYLLSGSAGPATSPTAGDSQATVQSLQRRLSALEREVAMLRALCRGRAEVGPAGEPVGNDRHSESILASSSASTEVASVRESEDDPMETNQAAGSAPTGRTEPETGTEEPSSERRRGRRERDASLAARDSSQRRRQERSKDRGRPDRRGRARGRPRDGDAEAGALLVAETEAGEEPKRGRKKDRAGEADRGHTSRSLRMSEPSEDGEDRESRRRRGNSGDDKETHGGNHARAVKGGAQAPSVFGQAIHIQGNRNGNIDINDDGWIRGFGMWDKVDIMDNDGRYFHFGPTGVVTVEEGGIYYVYSQILFYDSNATVGQSIYVNNAPRFTCNKSNISDLAKQSTCYVGGLVRMSAGDTVAIKLSVRTLTVALYADTSYFGLFRIA